MDFRKQNWSAVLENESAAVRITIEMCNHREPEASQLVQAVIDGLAFAKRNHFPSLPEFEVPALLPNFRAPGEQVLN